MWKALPAANTNCGRRSGASATSVETQISHPPTIFLGRGPSGVPLEPRSPEMLIEIYVGLDGAEDLVLEFIDLVATRGQFDLVAGAKVSFDADAILVREGLHGRFSEV